MSPKLHVIKMLLSGANRQINENRDFDDSTDATEFVLSIVSKLNEGKLRKWAEDTDNNFGTNAIGKLDDAIQALDEFFDELNDAGM